MKVQAGKWQFTNKTHDGVVYFGCLLIIVLNNKKYLINVAENHLTIILITILITLPQYIIFKLK